MALLSPAPNTLDTIDHTSRGGNLQRAIWRQKCRTVLANHIRFTLNIIIESVQVRLKPDYRDGYTWSCLPEKEYLFRKQLSKLSIGVYVELCREVGKSFEAVAYRSEDVRVSFCDPPRGVGSRTSFSCTVQLLRDETAKLQVESDFWQQMARAADHACGIARSSLSLRQDECEKVKGDNQKLHAQLHLLNTKLADLKQLYSQHMQILEN